MLANGSSSRSNPRYAYEHARPDRRPCDRARPAAGTGFDRQLARRPRRYRCGACCRLRRGDRGPVRRSWRGNGRDAVVRPAAGRPGRCRHGAGLRNCGLAGGCLANAHSPVGPDRPARGRAGRGSGRAGDHRRPKAVKPVSRGNTRAAEQVVVRARLERLQGRGMDIRTHEPVLLVAPRAGWAEVLPSQRLLAEVRFGPPDATDDVAAWLRVLGTASSRAAIAPSARSWPGSATVARVDP